MKKFPDELLIAVKQQSIRDCKGSDATKWTNCKGTASFEDGSSYHGEWKNGQANGQGVRVFSDGAKYVGDFKNGLFHGNGSINSPTVQK